MAYTTDDLVTDIRRDSFLPAVQSQWTTARILALADKVLLRRVIPALLGVNDGYYRETSDVSLTASTASYDLPRYAMFNKVHQVALVDSDGKLRFLEHLGPSDLRHRNATSEGEPFAFIFDADQITLIPTPSSGAVTTWPEMRAWIYRRPGRMVATTSAAKVQSVDSGTGIVTYTADKPSTFTSSSRHDFYLGESPFRRIGSATTATASGSTTTQTFSTTEAALLAADDYVCVRDETVFPPCSIEVVPFLEELVINAINESMGDRAAAEAARKNIIEDMLTLVGASANRADAQPKTVSLMHSPFVRGLRRRGMPSTNE